MSERKISEFDNGLRILARIIARAYLKDLAQKLNKHNAFVEKKEDDNANQRCDRSGEASPPGKSKAGSKEGKC